MKEETQEIVVYLMPRKRCCENGGSEKLHPTSKTGKGFTYYLVVGKDLE